MTLRNIFGLLCGALLLPMMTSCLGDDDKPNYTQWKADNEKYVADAETEKLADGSLRFSRLTPVWSPGGWSLIQWHNDRALTSQYLSPRDNSLVDVKYCLHDIEGNVIDSSYANRVPADSIYRTRPNATVVGFWSALTAMHIGDSVTVVVPWTAGYGASASGSVKPYSTLIFDLKLVDIVAYETPF